MSIPIISHTVLLQGAANSMQGGRPENQDDWGFVDTPLGFLLVVCDGMGGGPGGKTASYIAKNTMMAALQGCSAQSSRVDALKMAVSKANDALYQKMDEVPQLRGMGSTLVAILVNQQSAIIAHLGDSRCYRITHGRVAYRTDDHSLVGELVRNKALTEELARTSPQSNVIMRGLGNTSNHTAEIAELPYRKGDRFLLCTDGVWGIMPHEQLLQRLTSQQTLSALVDNLSAEIDQTGFSTGGHHDNHTLAALEMNTDSILKDKMSKIVKISFAVLAVLLFSCIVVNVVCMSKLGVATAKIDELEQQNSKLETTMAMYQHVKDGNTEELVKRVAVLQYEKESLEQSQAALIGKIDSLEKVVAELLLKANKSVKETVSKPTQKTSPSSATAQELAQRVVNLFVEMENAKGSTWQEAAKKKTEYRTKIVEQLLMLDKKTGGRFASKIAGVNRELKSSDPVTDKVAVNPKNKNEFVSTYPAKSKIQQLSNKIKEIKKQL